MSFQVTFICKSIEQTVCGIGVCICWRLPAQIAQLAFYMILVVIKKGQRVHVARKFISIYLIVGIWDEIRTQGLSDVGRKRLPQGRLTLAKQGRVRFHNSRLNGRLARRPTECRDRDRHLKGGLQNDAFHQGDAGGAHRACPKKSWGGKNILLGGQIEKVLYRRPRGPESDRINA